MLFSTVPSCHVRYWVSQKPKKYVVLILCQPLPKEDKTYVVNPYRLFLGGRGVIVPTLLNWCRKSLSIKWCMKTPEKDILVKLGHLLWGYFRIEIDNSVPGLMSEIVVSNNFQARPRVERCSGESLAIVPPTPDLCTGTMWPCVGRPCVVQCPDMHNTNTIITLSLTNQE